MLTLTAVVTCHDADPTKILGNLRYQTRRPDETLLYWSWADPKLLGFVREKFPEARILTPDNFNDWGHHKRAVGLLSADSDYVGFFNHDDKYDVTYVDKMMDRAADADVVFCDWSGAPSGCAFEMCSSTSGNFVVRTSVGRAAGYESRAYEADGTFINAVAALTSRIVYLQETLYFHNAG